MSTADVECPQEIQHAPHLEHLIMNSVASGVVHNNDLEDNNVIDISSDDSPAVRTKQKWVAKHIKTEPPSQCQAHPSKADI